MNITPQIQTKVRSFLNTTFEKRLKKNPQYSLRSFAKSMDTNPATMSQILSGKRPITKKRIEQFAYALEIPEQSLISSRRHENLSISAFKIISEWYHDAILELTQLDNFKPSLKWISNRLDLDINIVRIAVNRLQELELLEIQEDGTWIDTKKDTLLSYDGKQTNAALRKYQKNILDLSKKSVDAQERGERDHCSFVFSVDSSIVPEIHEKIKNFQLELMEFVEENSKQKDDVRALQFSSFKMTTDKESL